MLHQPSFCTSFHSNWCNCCPSTLQWPLEFPGSRVTKHYHGKLPKRTILKDRYQVITSIIFLNSQILFSHLPVENLKKTRKQLVTKNSAIGLSLFETCFFIFQAMCQRSTDLMTRWPNPTPLPNGAMLQVLALQMDVMKQQNEAPYHHEIRLQRLKKPLCCNTTSPKTIHFINLIFFHWIFLNTYKA